MFVPFKTALAVLFAASVPLQVGANTQPPSSVLLSAKEVRTAEAHAKTAEDQPGTGSSAGSDQSDETGSPGK